MSGLPVILRSTLRSTHQQNGTTTHVDFALARQTRMGFVQIAGTSWDTRTDKNKQPIGLSAPLIDTALAMIAATTEPQTWDTIEACRAAIAAQAPEPAPYRARYDRKGRLIPSNRFIRAEMVADRKALVGPQNVNDGMDPSWRPFSFPAAPQLARASEVAKSKARRELVLYTAAVGRKRGKLPIDLRGYHAAILTHDGGSALVRFQYETHNGTAWVPEGDPIDVSVANLAPPAVNQSSEPENIVSGHLAL